MKNNNIQHQTCKVCGRRDKFDFQVRDEIWEAVVPPIFHNRVVCLACFDNFALEREIEYAHSLVAEMYFAGDKAVFKFQIVSRVNV